MADNRCLRCTEGAGWFEYRINATDLRAFGNWQGGLPSQRDLNEYVSITRWIGLLFVNHEI